MRRPEQRSSLSPWGTVAVGAGMVALGVIVLFGGILIGSQRIAGLGLLLPPIGAVLVVVGLVRAVRSRTRGRADGT